MNNQQQPSQDVDETREPWERPRLTRLAVDSTFFLPGAPGPDGGTAFNQLAASS